jgi:UDP-2-acetamido-3-amino-2,3-dideoxy-glucuronate N-acetyltransferase
MGIASTADIDPSAVIGPGCQIWQLVQIREYARLGPGCILGRGA